MLYIAIGLFLAMLSLPEGKTCRLPSARSLVENTDMLHIVFSLLVIFGCFGMVLAHQAQWQSVSTIVSLVIGHVFGKASCNR